MRPPSPVITQSTATDRRVAALALLPDLTDSPLLGSPEELFAWLNERDPVLAAWVDGRTRRLREGQDTALTRLRRQRANTALTLEQYAAELRRLRPVLRTAQAELAELEAINGQETRDDRARQFYDSALTIPGVLGFQQEAGRLWLLLRYLLQVGDRVYDFGDWRFLLPDDQTPWFEPRLQPLRSGLSSGEGYWYSHGGSYQFTPDYNDRLYRSVQRPEELASTINLIWRALLDLNLPIDVICERMRIVRGADPEQIIRHPIPIERPVW